MTQFSDADFMSGGAAQPESNLLNIIIEHHGDTGIEQVHDLGSASSYDAGIDAQTLFDLKNANDAWRGIDVTAANDWTFNGTAGALNFTNYAGVNGSQWSRMKSQPAYIQAFHQNNALFTILGSLRTPTPGGSVAITGDDDALAGQTGFDLRVRNTRDLSFQVLNSGASVINPSSTAILPADTDAFFALVVDEATGAGGGLFDVNGTQESFNATYSGPSAGNASQTLEIFARGNGQAPMPNTSRLYGIAYLSEALSGAELDSIRTDYMGRT